MAEVTKIRFSHTMGDECPGGRSAFHRMFFVELHSAGTRASIEMPWLPGPRHCGQFSAETVAVAAARMSATLKRLNGIMRNVYSSCSVVASSRLPVAVRLL